MCHQYTKACFSESLHSAITVKHKKAKQMLRFFRLDQRSKLLELECVLLNNLRCVALRL
jgi:hypothetical protein